jgi:O-antigen/teichoic acid export membrane protein
VSAAGKAAAAVTAMDRLKRRAFSLGAARSFDYAMQFLLPIVLVRSLDATTFGEYRLLWLMIGTVSAVATLNMAGGLYYFLPRADARDKRLYVHQTLLFFAASGLVCAALVSPLNPLLPQAVEPLAKYGALVPAFVALWIAAMLLDVLPTVEEKIGWQVYALLGVGVLRVALLSAGAWLTGDLTVMLWLLLAIVLVKIALLLAYVRRRHGFGAPWFEPRVFGAQFRHVAPFGFSNSLYGLRAQADQWVAASAFALSSFAAFSIAAMLAPIVNVFRHSVVEAFLPSMSRMEAAGDVRGMLEMNRRANLMVGALLYPLLGFAFVFAEEIVTVIYTARYLEAAAVMRVYIAGMAVLVIEVGSVLLLLREGRYALAMSAGTLVFSVTVSWHGAQHYGLAGAAAGSVLALYLDRALTLRRIAARSRTPLSALQDWGGLARVTLAAALGGVLAWALSTQFFGAGTPMAKLIAGGVVLVLVYACMPAVARGRGSAR